MVARPRHYDALRAGQCSAGIRANNPGLRLYVDDGSAWMPIGVVVCRMPLCGGRPGLTYGRWRSRTWPGWLKVGEMFNPPCKTAWLTRRGDLLKAGAYATPTWSSGQRVAKILISITWMTGREMLAVCPGMVLITGPGLCDLGTAACRERLAASS
jgi:hypothetical protein